MKLVLLGTTGYHPNSTRHTACYMLPEAGLVFDAGSGFFRVREHLQTSTLDIFLSHAHLDHIFGLTFLFDVLHGKTMERVTLHGRPQDLKAIDEHLLAEALFPVKLPMQPQPLVKGPIPVGCGGLLKSFPLDHPSGSVGFRIDWPDRSLAYVTDTVAATDAAYIPEIEGVDVLIHECYFPDDMADWAKKTGHSWTSAVAETAKLARVGRLLLVHVNPLPDVDDPIHLDVARKIFPNCDIGRDNAVIEF